MYVYLVKRKRLGLLASQEATSQNQLQLLVIVCMNAPYVFLGSVNYNVSPTWIALNSGKYVQQDIPL